MNLLKQSCPRLALVIFLSITAPVMAAQVLTQEDVAAHKELLQLRLDANKELLQKDLEIKSQRMDALDKRLEDQAARIGDVGASVDRFGVVAGLLGTLITVALAAAGLFGYFSTSAKARREAEEASKKWFDDKAADLLREIATLKTKAAEAHTEIESQAQSVADRSAAANAQIEALQIQIGKSTTFEKTDEQNGPSALRDFAEVLKNRPETSYSFNDWNTRAFDAYARKSLSEAALYWGRAAEIPKAGAENVARALFAKGVTFGQLNRDEDAIAAYDAVIAYFEADSSVSLREQVARAMVNKGAMLGQLNRSEDAIAIYDAVIAKYEADPSATLREQVARAIYNKGTMLGQLNHSEDAIAVYDAVIAKYEADPSATLREQVARAIFNKGVTLGQLNRSEDAIAVYDAAIAKYEADPSATLRELVARAMVNKGAMLRQLNRSEDAVAIYDAVIVEYEADPSASLREQVARAMFNKGVMLAQLNRREDAVAVYSSLIAKYETDPSAALRELAVHAMLNKGAMLGQLNRSEDAIAIYDAVIAKYEADPSATLRELVADAFNGKGFSFLCSAKEHWSELDSRQKHMAQARLYFEKALLSKPASAMVLGNLAYLAWLQGDAAVAQAKFIEALGATDGGESIYKATLGDLDTHPVQVDEGFRVLMQRCWEQFCSAKGAGGHA